MSEPAPETAAAAAVNEYIEALRKVRSLKRATILAEQRSLGRREAAQRAGIPDADLRGVEQAIAAEGGMWP